MTTIIQTVRYIPTVYAIPKKEMHSTDTTVLIDLHVLFNVMQYFFRPTVLSMVVENS